MDSVDRAIEKGYQISKIKEFSTSRWEDYESFSGNRIKIVYGAGNGLLALIAEYPDLTFDMVIDADGAKQGKELSEICPDCRGTDNEKLVIMSPSVLDRLNGENTVFLLTGLKAYEELYALLKTKGFVHIFSFLCMEYLERQTRECKNLSFDEIRERYYSRCCLLPIKTNKILFRAFDSYADHGKYISEMIVKKREDIDVVWIVYDATKAPPAHCRMVSTMDWRRVCREMATSAVWIINSQIPDQVVKREGQIYIHTKHWASVTLKKFYLDAPTILKDTERKRSWEKEFSQIDHMITGSDFDEESCRRGFAFKGSFIRAGSPRSDAMFQRDRYRKKVFKHYGIAPDINVILYAPTYRFDMRDIAGLIHENRQQMPDPKWVRLAFSERFGGEWLIMRRLHPSLAANAADDQLPKGVVDATLYEDGQELCAACDAMITDYSSIMFEPAFVGRPVFLYAPDRDEYIHKEYDLLIDYDSLPFPIAETNEELMRNITAFDEKAYERNVKGFMDKYGVHEDGHASERAADFIINLINDNR